MMGRPFEFTVRAKVAANMGNSDPKHPQVQFFGTEFAEMSDQTLLTLHAYVQECLAFETDTLAQMLMLVSKEVETIE